MKLTALEIYMFAFITQVTCKNISSNPTFAFTIGEKPFTLTPNQYGLKYVNKKINDILL